MRDGVVERKSSSVGGEARERECEEEGVERWWGMGGVEVRGMRDRGVAC